MSEEKSKPQFGTRVEVTKYNFDKFEASFFQLMIKEKITKANFRKIETVVIILTDEGSLEEHALSSVKFIELCSIK